MNYSLFVSQEKSISASVLRSPEQGTEPESERLTQLDTVKAELAEKLKYSTDYLIESGRLLIQVKQLVGHGKFLPWLHQNFSMSAKTANRFMSVAQLVDRFKLNEQMIKRLMALDLKILYELAAKSTPVSVQQEVLDLLGREREISYEIVREFKQDYRPLVAKTSEAELMNLRDRLQRFTDWVEVHEKNMMPLPRLDEKSRHELNNYYEKLNHISRLLEKMLEQQQSAESNTSAFSQNN